ERDAARLARLVDDLLVLERQGAPASEPQKVRLDRLVQGALAEHDRLDADVVDAVSVRGDADALRRVLDNLIDNALVHGPPAGHVTVSLIGGDGAARLTVRDAGPGPDAGERERLFERFWRGPEAAGRPGSGLGLSIVA